MGPSQRLPLWPPGLLLPLMLASTLLYGGVWEDLRGSGACEDYQPMTAQQLGLGQSLFEQMLNGTPTVEYGLRQQWALLGYELIDIERVGHPWWGLRESGPECRGQGFYLVQKGGSGRLVVQVPHAFFDRYTGEIGAGLLDETISALAWNSVRRRYGKGEHRMNADLAKRSDSLFIALTRAFVSALPEGRLVQLHGFDNQRRKTAAGADAAVIVSGGSTWVTPAVASIGRCLQSLLDGPVRIFPRDVTELGGVRNLQGRILRGNGHEGFVHLELNRQTRERLRAEPQLSAGVAACLSLGVKQ